MAVARLHAGGGVGAMASYILSILLSLAVYAALCAAIARIFVRTGHSAAWAITSFLPFVIVLLAYVLGWWGYEVASGTVLMTVVLFYLVILVILAVKSWPIDGRAELAK